MDELSPRQRLITVHKAIVRAVRKAKKNAA